MKQRSLFSRAVLAAVLFLGATGGVTLAQSSIMLLDDAPVAPQSPSLGQQPFPVNRPPDLTPSQTNGNQLNQLFQFETTPNTSAAGEGYATVNLNFLKYPGSTKAFRYELQGQYSFTDQVAIGAFIPMVTAQNPDTHTGFGDVGIYGQYKLDQFVNPDVIAVTAQVDVILPTGNIGALRDTGKFGVRPLVLAYKDFGQHGVGDFGLYGLFGFTLTTTSDLRAGIAATYQVNDVAGILEFLDVTGKGRPLIEITPGFAYRGISPWEIAVGVPIGVNRGTPDWGVTCKITYIFQN